MNLLLKYSQTTDSLKNSFYLLLNMDFFFHVLWWILLISFVFIVVVTILVIYLGSKKSDNKYVDLLKSAENILEKK